MNTTINELVQNTETKLLVSDRERHGYKAGLQLLAFFVGENFLDMPVLPVDRFSTDGLFYTIPYLHDNTISRIGDTYTLIVVYRIKNGTSHCPLRIDFEFQGDNDFDIGVIEQVPARNTKKIMIRRKNGKQLTQIPDYAKATLSTLSSLLLDD